MGSRGPTPKTKSAPPTSIAFRAGVPEAPAWLDASARDEYGRIATLLAEITGHLQHVDMSVLCTYSQAYSDVRRLTLEIRGDPEDGTREPEGETLTSDKGNFYINPKVNVLSMAATRMKNAASQLGFTPSDRARITGRKSTTKKGEANPLDEFG